MAYSNFLFDYNYFHEDFQFIFYLVFHLLGNVVELVEFEQKSIFMAYAIIFIVVLIFIIISLKLKTNELREQLKGFSEKQSKVVQIDKTISSDVLQKIKDDTKRLYNGKIVNMTSIIHHFRELASSLEQNDIFRITSSIMRKSIGAKSGYFFLKNSSGEELYCIRKFNYYIGEKNIEHFELETEDLTFRISDTNALGFLSKTNGLICREGLRTNITDIHLINKCPIPFEVIFSVANKGKPLGVILITEFVEEDKEEITMEERQVIVSLGAILGVVLTNVQLLDMTRQDLVSTKQLSEKERGMKLKLKEIFSKYTSEKLVEQIMNNFNSVKLGGEKRTMTVFFADFKGFTEFSEKKKPEKVISILNKYLDSITKIIIKTNGNIDKFLGDGVMAFWGAPVIDNFHAVNAVTAAFEIQNLLLEMNKKLKDSDFDGLEMGIGINTGEMIIGNIGSSERMEYTVIGDSVNLASRIEGLSRKYNYSIIINKSTYIEIKKFFSCKSLGKASVKGIADEIEIFAVIDMIKKQDYNG